MAEAVRVKRKQDKSKHGITSKGKVAGPLRAIDSSTVEDFPAYETTLGSIKDDTSFVEDPKHDNAPTECSSTTECSSNSQSNVLGSDIYGGLDSQFLQTTCEDGKSSVAEALANSQRPHNMPFESIEHATTCSRTTSGSYTAVSSDVSFASEAIPSVVSSSLAQDDDRVSTVDYTKQSLLNLGDILVEAFACSSAPQENFSTIGCQADVGIVLPTPKLSSDGSHTKFNISEKTVHRNIYPMLSHVAQSSCVENVLKPFTVEQLRSLYYNFELEHVEEFVDSFIQQAHSVVIEQHEFYKIVLNYYRARHLLLGAERDVETMQQEVKKTIDKCWLTVEEKISLQGYCQDKSKVLGEVKYERAVFCQKSCQQVADGLKSIRDIIHNEFVLHAYEAQLSRLQVESYIYSMYSQNHALLEIPTNAPVQALLAHQRDAGVTYQVELLKQCISVLFLFQRKSAKDSTFISDSRSWLSKMVATLLRLATLEDHLFLLSHVLRCPAGIAKWACGFIQPVAIPNCTISHSAGGWGSVLLDHFVTSIAIILRPVREREEMLCQLKVASSPGVLEKPNESPWILVDSDGEEDEDPENSWCYLQENDYVALLNQFPLAHIFNHILFAVDDRGTVLYDVKHTTETGMLKLFAFVSCLIRIYGQGLRTFKLGRYRQLNKRIGRLISHDQDGNDDHCGFRKADELLKHTVQYTCDHWANFKSCVVNLPESTVARLQIESDMVLLRAVSYIMLAHRLGSWQFLAELPYEAASTQGIWRLLWLMHKGCCLLAADLDDEQIAKLIPVDVDAENCHNLLSDNANKLEFFDKLTTMPTSESVFLLTTFANMACSRRSAEIDFIETITGEIFEIAYVSNHTREFCSKPGRDILQSVCAKHPAVLSFLFQSTVQSLNTIGLVSHYLYRGLPVHLWHPSETDLGSLRRLLIDSAIQSVDNMLARLIISQLNWNVDSGSNSLFLDISLHQQMAVLLMDTMITHLSGKQISKLFMDGQIQSVQAGSKTAFFDEDTELAQWIWSVALRLKLHARSRPENAPEFLASISDSIAHGLVEEHRFTLALYFTLVMTACGHRDAEFCTEGVRYLSQMVEKSYFVPVVQCLFYVTPMFYQSPSYLSTNSTFMQSLFTTLQADWSRKSYFSYASPRCITNLFSSMIQTQIEADCGESGNGRLVIEFWLSLLTKLPNWYKEKDILFIIDNILKATFKHDPGFRSVLAIFEDVAKTTARDRGSSFLSSVVSWLGVAASPDHGSPLAETCSSDTVWLAYVSLIVESEQSIDMWAQLHEELNRSPISTSVENALSKVIGKMKLKPSPSAASLQIYRWAQLAVESPVDHPLLPLLWQQFMLLYFGHSAVGQGMPQRASVGDRFFTGGWQLSLMKRMKKRLVESAEHYRKLAAQCATTASSEESETTYSRAFYERLEKLYRTLSFWLDEPRLHDPNLYVLALPAVYQAQLLITVFQNQTELWLDYVDMPGISRELRSLAQQWDQRGAPPIADVGNNTSNETLGQRDVSTFSERIVSRIEHNTTDVLLPPSIGVVRSTIPDVSPELLLDQNSLLFALHSDCMSLVEHAAVYGSRVSKHVGLDCSYAELIPQLYKNVTTEGVLKVPCTSSFNPTHQCKGPASVSYRYDCKRSDELIVRKVDENRASYRQLLIESMLTPSQNLCGAAVHVENAITKLIKLSKSSSCSKTQSKANDVGIALFYATLTYVSEETKFYPPTRQFFSYCIEVLGQEFIRCNPLQPQPLLQVILQTPSLTCLLAPNFNPSDSPPELFVKMYEDLSRVSSVQGAEVAIVLLTKFEIARWLQTYKPVLSQRTALIESLSNALCSCGKEPRPSDLPILQIYCNHFKQFLAYQFPDHYGLMLRLLIKGSAMNTMSVDVWREFLVGIGAVHDENVTNSSPTHVSSATCVLPCSLMKESLEYISTYFLELRLGSDGTSTFGLYPTWAAYAPSISRLLGYYTAQVIRETAASSKRSMSADLEQVVSDLFKLVSDAYVPWIQPLDSNGKVLLPWILNEDAVAANMVYEWLSAVECLHHTFKASLPTFSRQALCLLWNQYVILLAGNPGVVDHILVVYHSRLVTMPWDQFYPDMHAIELMVKVATECRRSCFECLGNIFTTLPWRPIMQFYCTYEPREIVARLHVCLFTLFVRLGSERVIIENTSLAQLLWSRDIFIWDNVDASSYNSVVQWFADTCRPNCVVANHTTGVAQVISLLKMAAGFYPRPDVAPFDVELHTKRCCYVSCVVQLVCRCSTEHDVKTESLTVAINNLISEVESVVGSMNDPSQQPSEGAALCVELLSVLNNCGAAHSDMSVAFLGTIVKWIESSPTSVLLIPMVNAACQSLASTAHMVQVIEACLDSYFTLDVTGLPDCGWSKITATICVPELSFQQFVRDAIHYGCFLALYVHVLQQLPSSKSLDDELRVLNELLEWTTCSQPSVSNEAKILLWWHKMLELCLRQIDFGAEHRRVVKVLLSLIPHMIQFGEDKSSSGLFGAIGLGRKSIFSLRFRLVAKTMSAFLAAQIPSDASLRLSPDAPGTLANSSSSSSSTCSPSRQARQAFAVLESLRTNKQYSEFKETLEVAIDGISSQHLSFRDSPSFLSQLVTGLFAEINYLESVRRLTA